MSFFGKLCVATSICLFASISNAELKLSKGEFLTLLTVAPTASTIVTLTPSDSVQDEAIELQTEIALFEETGEMSEDLASLVNEVSVKLDLSFDQAYQMVDQKSFEIVENI